MEGLDVVARVGGSLEPVVVPVVRTFPGETEVVGTQHLVGLQRHFVKISSQAL